MLPTEYELLESLGPTAGSTLCRARRLADRQTVLLKLVDATARVPDLLARLRREHELLCSLSIPGVARPLALIAGGRSPAIVLEDCRGESLEAALAARGAVPLPVALRLACQLARIVAGLHEAQILHRDLRPANLVVDVEGGRVHLVDLSRALSRAAPGAETDDATYAQDLAYISPEQTGRMHRPVDDRSDLYSLGVVLYRLFTGVLPFEASDPLEWMHCHVARTPAPMREVVPELPQVLSDIVDKLLAKPPEGRYQSAHGLGIDLERCREHLDAHGEIDPFPLGTHDLADRLHVPQKLYGRAAELGALLEVYRRVAARGTPELVLVSGSSGVGKSALLHELQGPIVREGGTFIAGKFDQLKSDIPYATFAQALRVLVQRILAGSEEEVEDHRRRLRRALGSNAQIVVAILPELELVLGKQPPVPVVGALEAQNRFHATLHRFLDVFTRPQHPIALFLDDLQWADPASLALLEELLTHPGQRHLLLLGAYRDSDVTPEHPLMQALDRLRKAGAHATSMGLAPLTPEHLGQLVEDTFHCSPEAAAPLSRLVHAKTGGEPFFAIQFLGTLHHDHLIEIDAPAGAWRWDVDRIAACDYTDNVAELMLDRIRRLPETARSMMTLAACIGSRVPSVALERISGSAADDVHEALRPALREGLMLRTESAYRFLHDRIRQATYSLIPEDQRADVHLRVGRLLLAHASPEERAEGPFEIAIHFMSGASRIEDAGERVDVARLLLACSRRAKATAAHQSAAALLSTATSLLPAESEEDHHDLAYQLDLERADCAWLIGQYEEALDLLLSLLSRTRTTLEKLTIHAVKAKIHTIRGETDRAVESGLRGLRWIGFDISAHPSTEEVERLHEATWAVLGDRSIESLLDLPPATDPEMRAALDLSASLLDAASFTDDKLLAMLACFMVQTSIRHGSCESSAVGYSAFAMVLFGRKRHAEAYQFGKLARDLAEQLGAVASAAKIATYVGGTITPWIKPYRNSLAYLDSAARIGAENGDFLWTGYALAELLWSRFIAGEPLADVDREAEKHFTLVTSMKLVDVPNNFLTLRRCIASLRGRTTAPGSYDGDDFDEAAFNEALEHGHVPIVVATHHLWRTQVLFLFDRLDEALAASAQTKAKIWSLYQVCTLAEFHYFDALTRATIADNLAPEQRSEHMTELAAHEQALRAWAEGCPENYGTKHALVAAEIARLSGRDLDAERGYEQAIRLAKAGGLVQNEAIANELASRFYRARKVDSVATMYLREAHACYACWGADAKVAQIERQHPHLFAPRIRAAAALDADLRSAPAMRTEQLDLLSVLKVSQAISREIVLDDLLEMLMRVVLESAVAQTASLLLVHGGELARAAAASVDQQGVTVESRRTIALTSHDLPLSILNYVRRTRDQVLLGNASRPNPFSTDEYIVRRRPKSLLCLPILRQAELIGLLYLENNLVTDAFTPDRLAVLELLAGQAAISLENARLYADLRRENAERRQAETALRESRALLQDVVDNAAANIYVKDLEGRFLLVNRGLAAAMRMDRADLLGKTDHDLFPREQADAVRAVDLQVIASGSPLKGEETVPLEGGELHTYFSIKAPLTDSTGHVVGLCGISTDITERKRAEAELRRSEEQLRQAQKMEAIGNLAGGIAHDFNNLLSIILGYSGMLVQEMTPTDPNRSDVLQIEAAGRRAAELTRQLLAFARRQILQPKIVDLNQILTGIERMLRRLIGEHIDLTVRTDPHLGKTRVDPGQVEQIIVNLAVNSRDAMPEGGMLTLETANVELDETYVGAHPGTITGPHVMLAVTDTGIGMDKATQARIFEPFFTTKEKGKGTGLGLATVFGIVKQSGGSIWVYSEPGKGTCVKIHFPRTDATTADVHAMDAASDRRSRGSETILLVEDDAQVRALTRTILERFGYHVLETRSGADALRACEEHPGTIQLLLTDVIMPGINGPQLAERLRPLRPQMKVLYMSGYTDNAIVHHGILDAGVAFLQKPLTPERLTQKVREVLDSA